MESQALLYRLCSQPRFQIGRYQLVVLHLVVLKLVSIQSLAMLGGTTTLSNGVASTSVSFMFPTSLSDRKIPACGSTSCGAQAGIYTVSGDVGRHNHPEQWSRKHFCIVYVPNLAF